MTHPLTTLRTVDQDPISAMLWADEITDRDDRTVAIQYLCGHLPLTVEKWDEGVRMARAAVRIGAAEEWGDGLVEGMPEKLLRWLLADCAEVGLAERPHSNRFHNQACLEMAGLTKKWCASIEPDGLSKASEIWYEVSIYNGPPHPYWCARWSSVNRRRPQADDFDDARVHPGYPYVLRRLTYLCKAWAICGERAPALLYEGRCPIEWEDTP